MAEDAGQERNLRVESIDPFSPAFVTFAETGEDGTERSWTEVMVNMRHGQRVVFMKLGIDAASGGFVATELDADEQRAMLDKMRSVQIGIVRPGDAGFPNLSPRGHVSL